MGVTRPVPDWLSRRLAVARRLGAEVGALAMRMRPAPGADGPAMKGRQDWLTEADGAVERLLAEAFARELPEDGFQGEEEGVRREAGAGGLRWVVDPIDGTSNYSRGGSRWCVSLGLLEGDAAVLGVLAAPASGEVYEGVRGGGATLNGVPIRAAGTTEMGRAIVEVGWSPRVRDADWLRVFGRVMAAGAMGRSGGSGAMGLAEVAAGRLDGYMELHINLWDCCAALAILGEAGAYVNGFLPGGIVAGGPVLGCAPGLAAVLEEALAPTDADSGGRSRA